MTSIACPLCDCVVKVGARKQCSILRFHCGQCEAFECAAKDYRGVRSLSAARKQHCLERIQTLQSEGKLLCLARSSSQVPPAWKLMPVAEGALDTHELPPATLQQIGIVASGSTVLARPSHDDAPMHGASPDMVDNG